jgi:rhodanese-related sulfurtransferase
VALLVLAVAVLVIGTPSTESKYARLKINRTVNDQQVKMTADQALAQRQMQITPAELFKTMNDDTVKLTMIDVRPEADYNLFHIRNAVNIPNEQLKTHVPGFLATAAPNAVYVVASNGEDLSTKAWKTLAAEGVQNVYILEGGVNNWIAYFGKDDPGIKKIDSSVSAEQLQFNLPSALGDRYQCADPSPIEYENLEFIPKIQLQLKRDKSGGGCG